MSMQKYRNNKNDFDLMLNSNNNFQMENVDQ
jgi:hypothetical protein